MTLESKANWYLWDGRVLRSNYEMKGKPAREHVSCSEGISNEMKGRLRELEWSQCPGPSLSSQRKPFPEKSSLELEILMIPNRVEEQWVVYSLGFMEMEPILLLKGVEVVSFLRLKKNKAFLGLVCHIKVTKDLCNFDNCF